MSFNINMDLLRKAREDSGTTVAPMGEQINYIAPDPVEDELDIFADTTADNTIGTLPPNVSFGMSGLDNTATAESTGAIEPIGSGFGAFGMDIDYDPDTYVSNDIVREDTRPDFIKNSATSWEERQKQLNWYLENDYDPDTGYKLSQAEKDRLRFELEDGQGLWQAMQSDDPQTAIAAKNAMIQGGINYGKNDAIKYGVPLTMLVGDIASGGMLSAGRNIITGITEGDLGKIAEGALGAGLTLTAKDIKSVTEAAETAAKAGDWAKAAELSREAEQLKQIKSGISTASALASGNIGTALLSGAPLVGVDPVGSVTEMVFGQDATFDDSFAFDNNYKFGGGFDVSAASEGIVQAGGKLLDTGGDVGEALTTGLMTYAREGGSLPDIGFQGEGYWGLPSINLGKYLPDINLDAQLPEWLRFNPDFDIDGWKASGLAWPDWLKINGGNIDLGNFNFDVNNPFGNLDLNLDVNNPFDNLDINLPKIPSVDIGLPNINPDINLPNINVPEFDVNLSGLETDFNVDGLDIGEFEGFNVDLPSLKFELSEGDKKQLEELPETAKIQVASILTDATFLQLTPLQQRDYLDELLRSMQT